MEATQQALTEKGLRSRDAEVTFEDLIILNKEGELQPLILNPVQRRYLDDLIAHYGGWPLHGVLDIVLKARQHGISTLVEAIWFMNCCNLGSRNSAMVAPTREDAEVLFERVHRMYENLPPHKKPRLDKGNVRELVFADRDAKFSVLTAGASLVTRGMTYHDLHASEASRYEDPGWLGAMKPSVPKNGNFIIESTANGTGDAFHTIYMDAKQKTSPYRAVFLAWFDNPEYAIEPQEDFKRTPEEELLAKDYGLTDAQLAWRRREHGALRAMGGEQLFRQEYPSNDIEAFIMSGTTRFNQDTLHELTMDAATRKPIAVGDDGFVVYEWPEPGVRYVIGADPTEGSTKTGFGRDYHAAVIIRRGKLEQPDERDGTLVARYIARDVEPHDFARILDRWGRRYNNALLCCEINNSGHGVIVMLSQVLDYPNMFRIERFDRVRGRKIYEAGFMARRTTKVDTVSALATMLEARELWPVDDVLVSQLTSYITDERGKLRASHGHDDLVSALICATYALIHAHTDFYPFAETTDGPVKDKNPFETDEEKEEEDAPFYA